MNRAMFIPLSIVSIKCILPDDGSFRRLQGRTRRTDEAPEGGVMQQFMRQAASRRTFSIMYGKTSLQGGPSRQLSALWRGACGQQGGSPGKFILPTTMNELLHALEHMRKISCNGKPLAMWAGTRRTLWQPLAPAFRRRDRMASVKAFARAVPARSP